MKTDLKITELRDNIRIKGKVIIAHEGEIRVQIFEPYEGISAGIHSLFHQKGKKEFYKEHRLTEEGRKLSGQLLLDLYDYCLFFDRKKADLKKEYAPVKERLDVLYGQIKELVAEMRTGGHKNDIFKSQQKLILDISWINHEFFKQMSAEYTECRKMGMDTMMQLCSKFLI